uniref:AAA+ ATPase domain-containing protein n=1 Tax=Setaria viridis TaxID=4556 RepID=A0A4U6UJF2_SETVI|nr:hypothetical protein SEVIR_5G218800v2 [Setaria viridis]
MDRMMVSVAGGAMGSLLQKVGSLTAEQGSRLMGVPADIEWLKRELRSMKAFLMGLSDIEDPDEVVKCWKEELRELSYDMEDAIDMFVLRDGHGRGADRRSSSSSSTVGFMEFFQRGKGLVGCLKSYYAMAGNIQQLRGRVLEAEQRRKRYQLSEPTMHHAVDTRVVALYREALSLVGVDGPREAIISWLMGGDNVSSPPQDRRVVSIVGFGGIGKTTLAKQIFDKIKGQFDCAAFVSVSREPRINYIFKQILLQFQAPDRLIVELGLLDQQGDHQPFIDLLRRYLQGKRYIVVVDDIWKKQAWEIINCGLFKNGCGGRIITTTRIYNVAKWCTSGGGYVHRMEPLHYDDSRRLFLRRVFNSEVCHPCIEPVFGKILRKCGGSPLAILTVSSILVDKGEPDQWEQVCNSIGMGISHDGDVSAMRMILSHSYFDLPHHLRACLLYLSIFPEDHVIERKLLVYRWIAEGFVHAGLGENITKVGESYFHELINRNLIKPTNIEYDGRASACQVHDTILDFIVSKSIEENYVTLLGPEEQGLDKKIHRLSIHNCQLEEDIIKLEGHNLAHVRSLNIFDYMERIPSGLTNLRVLHLDDYFYDAKDDEDMGQDLDQFIGNVTEHIHLKYLGIRKYFYIHRLPEEFGNLRYLETLDIRYGLIIEELPASINKLQCLVRLFVPFFTTMPYGGIGEMKALEELETISVTDQSLVFLKELSRLTRLRILGLHIVTSQMDDDMALALMPSLNKLGRWSLRSLSVEASTELRHRATISLEPCLWQRALQNLRKIKIDRVAGVPAWMGSLNNLEQMKLVVLKVDQHQLDVLGGLRNLLHLDLNIHKYPDEILIFNGSKGFQSLRYLHIYMNVSICSEATRRRVVMFEAGSMPQIQYLNLFLNTSCRDGPCSERHIRMCMLSESKFSNFYDMGIENLSSLTIVEVVNHCCVPMAAEIGEATIKKAKRNKNKLNLLITVRSMRFMHK